MAKPPRADFALPGGKFPLNTAGRVKVAPELAAVSRKKGNITAAQEATVDRAAADKRGNLGEYLHAAKDNAKGHEGRAVESQARKDNAVPVPPSKLKTKTTTNAPADISDEERFYQSAGHRRTKG